MRVEHIAIWTNNLERLKEFYVTYFDAQANQKYINASKTLNLIFVFSRWRMPNRNHETTKAYKNGL